jgi:elongation factor 3
MTDIKKDLATLATETLVKCCGAVGNKDIEPFIPNLVRCIAQPEEVQDCVHKLAATTFVQAVDAKTLALLVPLLLRGLQERSTPIRRKACVIIDNMAKLVDSPVDALEFSNLLTPYVDKCVKEMSNPEARTMAERASKTLAQTAADATSQGANGEDPAKADPEAVQASLSKCVADVSGAELGADAEAALTYSPRSAPRWSTSRTSTRRSGSRASCPTWPRTCPRRPPTRWPPPSSPSASRR